MRKTIVILGLFLLLIFSYACDKETMSDDSCLVSYDSLIVARDTIPTGATTTLTAYAQGTALIYCWESTGGDILGSGSEVTYVAPTCIPGDNEITCVVKSANKSESKTIVITVF